MERLRIAVRSTVLVLISLGVWGELRGMPGGILATQVAAILTIVFYELAATRPAAESTHGS